MRPSRLVRACKKAGMQYRDKLNTLNASLNNSSDGGTFPTSRDQFVTGMTGTSIDSFDELQRGRRRYHPDKISESV